MYKLMMNVLKYGQPQWAEKYTTENKDFQDILTELTKANSYRAPEMLNGGIPILQKKDVGQHK